MVSKIKQQICIVLIQGMITENPDRCFVSPRPLARSAPVALPPSLVTKPVFTSQYLHLLFRLRGALFSRLSGKALFLCGTNVTPSKRSSLTTLYRYHALERGISCSPAHVVNLTQTHKNSPRNKNRIKTNSAPPPSVPIPGPAKSGPWAESGRGPPPCFASTVCWCTPVLACVTSGCSLSTTAPLSS